MAFAEVGDTGVEVTNRHSAALVVKAFGPAGTPASSEGPFHLRHGLMMIRFERLWHHSNISPALNHPSIYKNEGRSVANR